MARLKKDDQVVVIAGKDKGKKGRLLRVFTDTNKGLVERVNLIKKHTRPTQDNPKGGIIEKENPISLSNLMPFCGRCDRQARIGVKILESGDKMRICRRCQEVL
ncbi:MAG: 50S ribosomal protein L24 [Candidatus Omnitrophica bacterium]|nr:50S ribosomal protein L24 [Candidatus Omnitrophota bacterium]MCK4422443.1 50S ribosomal protein L24 [Candidatus Omnitrophota bacterium]